MDYYIKNIEQDTLENENYRKVVFTGPKSQLVLMSLKPGQEIGMETHDEHDQFIRVESGEAKAVLNGNEYDLHDDYALIVPAGTAHNIINVSSSQDLKLYTIYSPPEHPKETIQEKKPNQ